MTQLSKNQWSKRRVWLFVFLTGLFVTNAVTAELISNKLIEIPMSFSFGDWKIGPFVTIIGILPWPIVFLLTDLLNEFYGAKAVRRVSWITAVLIAYCFVIIGITIRIPAFSLPGADLASDQAYNQVFGQAQMVIVGSIIAFLVSQLIDAFVFDKIKKRTGNRFIWLRSTGSTLISQLIDSFIVLYVGFVLPGKIQFADFPSLAFTNYSLKIFIAIALTPLIYVGHYFVKKYLSKQGFSAEQMPNEVDGSN
jgi:uncharacterized integral membrane protein (TIGR00697 family)